MQYTPESRNGHFQDAAKRARGVFGGVYDLATVSTGQHEQMTDNTRAAQITKLKETYRTGRG